MGSAFRRNETGLSQPDQLNQEEDPVTFETDNLLDGVQVAVVVHAKACTNSL